MKYEIGTYLVCLGGYDEYLPAYVSKMPNTIWEIKETKYLGVNFSGYPIFEYTLSCVGGRGCIRNISEYWLCKDFKPLNDDEIIIKDILE